MTLVDVLRGDLLDLLSDDTLPSFSGFFPQPFAELKQVGQSVTGHQFLDGLLLPAVRRSNEVRARADAGKHPVGTCIYRRVVARKGACRVFGKAQHDASSGIIHSPLAESANRQNKGRARAVTVDTIAAGDCPSRRQAAGGTDRRREASHRRGNRPRQRTASEWQIASKHGSQVSDVSGGQLGSRSNHLPVAGTLATELENIASLGRDIGRVRQDNRRRVGDNGASRGEHYLSLDASRGCTEAGNRNGPGDDH